MTFILTSHMGLQSAGSIRGDRRISLRTIRGSLCWFYCSCKIAFTSLSLKCQITNITRDQRSLGGPSKSLSACQWAVTNHQTQGGPHGGLSSCYMGPAHSQLGALPRQENTVSAGATSTSPPTQAPQLQRCRTAELGPPGTELPRAAERQREAVGR